MGWEFLFGHGRRLILVMVNGQFRRWSIIIGQYSMVQYLIFMVMVNLVLCASVLVFGEKKAFLSVAHFYDSGDLKLHAICCNNAFGPSGT